ncbi:hypothetical protein D3C72_1544480 [compost metagenome]
MTTIERNDGYSKWNESYRGRVVGFSKGQYELHNGAQDGRHAQVITADVSKSVPCRGFVCEKELAIDKSDGEIYRIENIFANGTVFGNQGNPNYSTRLHTRDLYRSCKCIGELCEGGAVISPKGESFFIYKVFQNGMVAAGNRFYSPAEKTMTTMEELGFKACSTIEPCACNEQK